MPTDDWGDREIEILLSSAFVLSTLFGGSEAHLNAKRKLEGFDSLEEETSSHWSEIVERRYDFEAYRKEVQCLRTLTKDEVITAYDDWLLPVCQKEGKPTKRRRLVIQVIGSGDGANSLGRPVVGDGTGDYIEGLVEQFHHSVNHETWQ